MPIPLLSPATLALVALAQDAKPEPAPQDARSPYPGSAVPACPV